MTWLPGATVIDLSRPPYNRGNGPFSTFLGVILHVNGDENGTTDEFFETNAGQVTPNFQVYKDGSIHQYLPIDWQPWCQVDGNFNYAAIETAGQNTEALTDAQIVSCARIVAAYRAQLGMQMVLADTPGQPGFGWHGMGGDAWGGHPYCPGEPRKAQRAQILALANQGEEEMPLTQADADLVVKTLMGRSMADVGFAAPLKLVLANTLKNATTGAEAASKAAASAGTGGVDVAALAQQIVADLGPDLAKQVAAELGAAITKGAAS